MWGWHWWCCLIPETLQKQPNQSLLLITQTEDDAVWSDYISFSAIARMLTSWLNRRRRRYLFLILCSPFLLPLFFATCPFICAVEICFLMCRKRKASTAAGRGGDGRSGGDEVGLLQRYLEDQLLLVVASVGDDDGNVEEEDGVHVEYFDSARPLLK